MPLGIPSSRDARRYTRRTADEGSVHVSLERALAAYSEDLLETGDARLALERAFRWGYQDDDAQPVRGLQERIQDLRHQRDRLMRQVEHDRFLEGLAPELDRLDALEEASHDGAAPVTDVSPMQRIAGRLEAGYRSQEAQDAFDRLLDELREDLLNDRSGGVHSHPSPAAGQPGAGLGAVRSARQAAVDRVRRMLFHGGSDIDGERTATRWKTGVAERVNHDLRTLAELERIDETLGRLESIGSVMQLGETDLASISDIADAEVSGWLREWRDVVTHAAGKSRPGGQLDLPPEVVRAIGRDLLKGLFRSVTSPAPGEHASTMRGNAGDPAETTREWEPGRPLDLNLIATLSNAVRRSGIDRSGRIAMTPDDFAVVERTATTAVSTVLAIDRSRSMGQSGAWTAAKKVSLAMHELIRQSYPRDRLELVAFSSSAAPAPVEDIPEMRWDEFEHGTNLQAALELGRRMLRRDRAGTRQIVIITDGEPTLATISGENVFASPPTDEVLNATMAEVIRCTREKITINLVILGGDAGFATFAEQVAKVNGGRIFTATNQSLGAYILRDYVGR